MYFKNLSEKEKEYTAYLPDEIREAYGKIPEAQKKNIGEIRLKNGGYATVTLDSVYFLTKNGELSKNKTDALFTNKGEFASVFSGMCQNSVYAMQSDLKQGFITLRGGHRVGVCGRVNTENGKIISMSEISSINIRIAREIRGAADVILPYIIKDGTVLNTIIISPPGCGKTTMLRDIARQLGGEKYMLRVGIADERGEIAAVYHGQAQNNVGALTDVYTGCGKEEGMKMLIRGMSPDVIITDEIGTKQDEEALFACVNAGAKIICSAHGYGVEDVQRKEAIASLIQSGIIERKVVLSCRGGFGTVDSIV